jgi:hypothetical protein
MCIAVHTVTTQSPISDISNMAGIALNVAENNTNNGSFHTTEQLILENILIEY